MKFGRRLSQGSVLVACAGPRGHFGRQPWIARTIVDTELIRLTKPGPISFDSLRTMLERSGR